MTPRTVRFFAAILFPFLSAWGQATKYVITTAAGTGADISWDNGGPAKSVAIGAPKGIALDASGNMYVVSNDFALIGEITQDGNLKTVAGLGGFTNNAGDGGLAINAQLFTPVAIAFDTTGNLYIADAGHNRVRKVGRDNTITALAGSGISGYTGDGGSAVAAHLSSPSGVAVDAGGNVYIADTANHVIRKVTPNGIISTFAGGGDTLGDGGPAISAQLLYPGAVAVDNLGNVYIADSGHDTIRKVDTSGRIHTIAGQASSPGYAGDIGPATSAQLQKPQGLALDAAGNLFIADTSNHAIRRIDSNGTITTIAGLKGVKGNSGDGGLATAAALNSPWNLAITADGTIYIADSANNLIRLLTPQGSGGSSGFSLSLASASFNAAGGTGTVAIATSSPSAAWTASSNVTWITFVSATSGTGNGTVVYSVASNPSVGGRTGALTIAGQVFTVTQAGQSGGTGTSDPVIQATGGVVNGASFVDGLASGTWITVTGSNLSSTTRTWQSPDFAGNNLPTSLDGVRVTVNGRAAYVYYVSPTQLNVLAPEDSTIGPVPVQVTTSQGVSNTVMVDKQAVAPAFFVYSQQGGRYAIAEDGGTYAFLGPAGLLGSGAATAPATPGEVITLYATGLGSTSPPYPGGQIIQSPVPLSAPPQVLIGDVPASIQFAGLIGPGLYQINVVVPNLPTGDASIVVNVNGTSSPASIFLAIQGQSTGNGPTLRTSYSYDSAGRIASITYPSGWKVAYQRDAMGRNTGVTAQAAGGKPVPVISNVAYEPFGPVSALKFGNGVTETRSYDLDYRLTSLTSAGNKPVQNLAYSYDAADNVSSINDGVAPGNTQRFGYDPLDRITNAIGGYGNLGYSYDSVGNRITQTLAGSSATTYSYTPATNRLLTVAANGAVQKVGYTAAGNINSFDPGGGNPVSAYNYSQAERLAGVTSGSQQLTQYTYDAFGHRVAKATANGGTLFQYDQRGNLLEESDKQGHAQVDYIYLEDRPVATIAVSTGKLYFLHDDRLGTPQVATDSSQAVTWVANYQPFGAIDAASSNTSLLAQNLRLPGQENDVETGLYHNGFRDYLPGLGRYLQSDPIGLVGGVNTYAYVGANPVNRTDLYGTSGEWDCAKLGDCSHVSESTLPFPRWTIIGDSLEIVSGTAQFSAGVLLLTTVPTGIGALFASYNITEGYIGFSNGMNHYDNDLRDLPHGLGDRPSLASLMIDPWTVPGEGDFIESFIGLVTSHDPLDFFLAGSDLVRQGFQPNESAAGSKQQCETRK